jgi:hypothetical protein
VSLLLVNGGFRIVGDPLDGDLVRFLPDDRSVADRAGWSSATDSQGGLLLHLEGIETLESRYVPYRSRWVWRQAPDLAAATAVSAARELGFVRAEFDDAGVVTHSDPERARGYVLVRGLDRHGRLVGYAFRGRRPGNHEDLSENEVDLDEILNSTNWALLRQGLAYCSFHSRMEGDLRDVLADAVAYAQERGRGVWPRDATEKGLNLGTPEEIRVGTVVYPRLFRRLAEYLEREGIDLHEQIDPHALPGFLRTHDEEVFLLSEERAAEFSSLVWIEDRRVGMDLSGAGILFHDL